MTRIEFQVPAIPVAQPRQRHRVVTAHGRTFAQNFTPAKHPVNAFKASIQHEARAAYSGPTVEGPVCLSLAFLFPRPGRMVWKTRPMPRDWHTSKPDAENVVKAVQDALTSCGLWRDDSQVCGLEVTKQYAAGDEQPGVRIIITSLAG